MNRPVAKGARMVPTDTDCRGESVGGELPAKYVKDYYRSNPRYSLKNINSIYFYEGKFYDMLERMSPKRSIHCRCVKSNCNAKYCECFRAGETCGKECCCLECHNRKRNRSGSARDPAQLFSCKCVKSGCLKKYCECFQNGKKCNAHCRCSDCCNGEMMEEK